MRALILVDLQNDFLPGGALAVPHGDEVLPVANKLLAAKAGKFELVVATQDWHPPSHGSFAANQPGTQPWTLGKLAGLDQVMWPNHCVQGSRGAEFASMLDLSGVDRVFRKGTDPKIDSYSGFYDNGKRQSTGLGEFLRDQGVTEVVVLGLATDYCVKFTALDALGFGFRVVLIEDACRAVNLAPGDSAAAVEAMRAAGVRVVTSTAFLKGSAA